MKKIWESSSVEDPKSEKYNHVVVKNIDFGDVHNKLELVGPQN